MRSFYAFHDSDKDNKRTSQITLDAAKELQAEGFGIFHTVNEFNGPRKIANLKKIYAWYIDLDDYTDKLEKLLKDLPLYPSSVVKTKSGFHVYFNALDATAVNYKTIGKRLIHACGGKESVYDLSRLLRVPGFFHLKDPSDPFLVSEVFNLDAFYSEKQMLYILKPHPDELKVKEPEAYVVKSLTSEGVSYADRIHNANQEVLLQILSGKGAVGGEQYGFVRVAGGKKNIIVNGKPTPCWIDTKGKIGSQSGGGPSVIQWLMWLGHDFKDTIDILKKEVGEL